MSGLRGRRALGSQAGVSQGGEKKSVLNTASQGRGGPRKGHGTWQGGSCSDLELRGFRGGEVTVAAWRGVVRGSKVGMVSEEVQTEGSPPQPPRDCRACRGYDRSCHHTAGSQREWSSANYVPTSGLSGNSECGWREDTGVTTHTVQQRKKSGMWHDRGIESGEITADRG